MRDDTQLEQALAEATGILFLCSGNMIRSAFAELYARHLGCRLPVRSAATTYRNAALHPRTREALLARGVSPDAAHSFRPTMLADLLDGLDARTVVFGMTAEHLDALGPVTQTAFLLPRLHGELGEIPDPLFEGGFEHAFGRIAELVETLVGRVGQ